MNDIILIVILMCGKPDTVMVKFPDKPEVIMTRQLDNDKVLEKIGEILDLKPVVITYEDERRICV